MTAQSLGVRVAQVSHVLLSCMQALMEAGCELRMATTLRSPVTRSPFLGMVHEMRGADRVCAATWSGDATQVVWPL